MDQDSSRGLSCSGAVSATGSGAFAGAAGLGRRGRGGGAVGNPFQGGRDRVEIAPVIRQVDRREQQRRDPEDVVMGEERNQRQDGDKLKMRAPLAMGHLLGQGVQLEVEDPQSENQQDDKNRHDDEERVGLSGDGNI